MADNSYTAFDPIFLSYHANIDRMLETWVRAHPGTHYTTQTQLQPFVGPLATAVNQSTAGSNESTVICGNFANLMIGLRNDIRIEILKERYADTHQYGFVAVARFDVGVSHASAFHTITGVTA